ncbi:unnamed protein product [Nippostrongylus brasiliensis]|uniref:receptor protein-tyrosine kinase n=1 Tax=Nippostrongylus brasiliensis TaxID=27835 RepID=A0A0N4YHV0_NIPBR|nr:unnamed protein product [Nippostrongylus brasiliensis]
MRDTTTTPAPRAVSVLMGSSGAETQPDTCPKSEGCCKCPSKDKRKGVCECVEDKFQMLSGELDEGVESQTAFENAVHNVVFVQKRDVSRQRRAIVADSPTNRSPGALPSGGDKGTIKDILPNKTEAVKNDVISANVTSTSFTIKGLKHYTRYFVQVTVCQDPTAPETHCSTKRAWRYVRTKPIVDADRVDNSTINVEVLNGTSNIRITWMKPVAPNGMIVAYKVKVINTAKQSTPVDQCIPASSEWSPNVNGAVFEGLNDGDYRVELRTVSLAGVSQPAFAEKLFEIYSPGFWTLKNILLSLLFVLLFAVTVGIVGYFFVKKYYSQKVKEYATQLISANPEYLSQADVYKPDEWELQRSDLTLECEIGRGTFGKVYRGYGNNVLSRCGDTFGLCAIKTVTETANSAERLHFLLEANVMKSFSAEAFIVKLYGVVSDGQPVLVVMEMMEKASWIYNHPATDYVTDSEPNYVSEDHGTHLLNANENTDEVQYRLMNRVGGARPRWGEGDSLDTDCEAEDEV